MPAARTPELHKTQGDDDFDTEESSDEDDDDDLSSVVGTTASVPVSSPSQTAAPSLPVTLATGQDLRSNTSQSLVARPRAASLGRDISICFVSAPVQILHRVFPLSTFITNAQMTEECKTFLIKQSGPAVVKLFQQALNATRSIFRNLGFLAFSGVKVDKSQVSTFRDAFDSVSIAEGSNDRRGDWRGRDADASDFLSFVLKHLSQITHSGESDKDLLGEILGQSQPVTSAREAVEVEARHYRDIYDQNAYNSGLHACYAVHCVLEEECDSMSCGTVMRTHEIMPQVRFQMTTAIAAGTKEVPLEDLGDHFSHGDNDRDACKTCESCGNGKMVSWRQRLVNDPDILMVNIQRVLSIDQQNITTFVSNRIQSRDINSFNSSRYLKEQLFSETGDTTVSKTKYKLVGMIMYSDSPPHYIAFVREQSDHSGAWVCFDDTEECPKYESPFSSRYEIFCETLLVYRRTATRPKCDECLRLKMPCLHNELGHFDPEECFEWLEWRRNSAV